jgi:mono/diheme cytochrome c family protein
MKRARSSRVWGKGTGKITRLLAPIAMALTMPVILGACDNGTVPAPRGGSFTGDVNPPSTPVTIKPACTAARASEDLQPRADLMGITGSAGSSITKVQTSDLFARFYAICGSCHVDAANGGHHVDEATFATTFDQTWFVHIKSDDPSFFMPPPPGGKPFSSRAPDDPVVELANYLSAWLAQGRPADSFTIDTGTASTTASSYGFTPDLAAAMTNLGTCIPNQAAYQMSTSGMMESKDEFFATATALPQNLADTDLTTFDSQALAAVGVVAYVPTYPLWSAGSGKLRHIRVPKGQTIRFDKATQSFDIPPNTRFYKTFFRKVVDKTGALRNRKMETRLIVARADGLAADGTATQTALFGTYVWSDDESMATLQNLRYRDGTLFADQLRTYITDELTYAEIVDSTPPGANFDDNVAEAAAGVPGLQQHYAIPGRIRCVQCHMGSPSKNFVLGFFPLQVARRETGSGGTYEETGDDELTQLQRLIDYGVISGMTSPSDVLPLEESEGARKPRTQGELNAQAYMVGNCAHCHNPRGLPSVSKPELTPLQFLPTADTGGVFEMDSERESPIRFRGANGDIPVPYITPSLRDYPVTDIDMYRMDNGNLVDASPSADIPTETTWTPKYDPASTGSSVPTCASADGDTVLRSYCGARRTGYSFVPAPWRSLIYRNVDTPFPYFDDYVPFPHMPMNTFGFDCRAPRIMGDWMVGLPEARKLPDIREDALPKAIQVTSSSKKVYPPTYDSSPQPYQPVMPDDPGYAAALTAAQARLDEYHTGVRYNYCETVLSPDILDPITPPSSPQYKPNPLASKGGYLIGGVPPLNPLQLTDYVQPAIGVPYHSHFFAYDPTDPPPPWTPRRADWEPILVESQPDGALPAGGFTLDLPTVAARKVLSDAIKEAAQEFSPDLQAYALKELPYGLWQPKPECQQKLASQPLVSSFQGGGRPAWMDTPNVTPSAPVYMGSPGAMLYRHICFNCHGPKADGRGLQADALSSSSDGDARPANFREGLFGPSTSPGANMLMTYGTVGTVMPDMNVALSWAARYMAWMTLGGTLKIIPQDIIHLVEATKVFGASRPNLSFLPANQVTANMLNLAKGLCTVVLPDTASAFAHFGQDSEIKFSLGQEPNFYPPFNSEDAPFITTNEDKEMWLTLCTGFSPAVVRVYEARANTDGSYDAHLTALYYADAYPATAPVLDQNRVVQMGVHTAYTADQSQPMNFYPACLKADSAAAAWLADKPIRTKTHMPDCPPELFANGKAMWHDHSSDAEIQPMIDNITRWSLRGAIAAGMSVFTYLEHVFQSNGALNVVNPAYNECQLLP